MATPEPSPTTRRVVLFLAINLVLAFAALTALSMARGGTDAIRGDLVVIAVLWGAIASAVWVRMSGWLTRHALVTVEAESKQEIRAAKNAANTLVRLEIAKGLAPLFLQRSRPYEHNAELTALLDARRLKKMAFVQKPPQLLQFYKRLLFALDRAPASILEIGVKGGGSTALWKAIFPQARVVGMDIKLRGWLPESGDGVVYVQGDQRDEPRLQELSSQFGPWDIVIDDGSHVSSDQVTTLRTLLPHVSTGGFYIIEDTHSTLKTDHDTRPDYGADIWPDFVLSMFERRRGNEPESALAREVGPLVDDVIVGPRVLAMRRK